MQPGKHKLSRSIYANKADRGEISVEKPIDIEQYKIWIKKAHDIDITQRTRIYYDTVTNKIRDDFEKSKLWKNIINNLKDLNEEYRRESNGYILLDTSKRPNVYRKTFESFLLKTYRKNVLENERWPEKPANGEWILPDEWYGQIQDIVRTRFVVQYIDGVDFLIKYICSHCKDLDIPCQVDFEARNEGYYAAHLYIRQEFEIPKQTWDTKKFDAFIEIQIMTQLQDHIVMLLHEFYEDNRKKNKKRKNMAMEL